MNADFGIYVQDSWRLTNRLTIARGIRFEYLNASIEARTAPAGRFVPARQFPEVPDLPNWFNIAPRFGVVYDLTGDARTALKGTINRYSAELHDGHRGSLRSAVPAERHPQLVGLRLRPGHVALLGCGTADQRRQHRPGQRDRAEQQPHVRRGAQPACSIRTASGRTTWNTRSVLSARSPRRVGRRHVVHAAVVQLPADDQHARERVRLRAFQSCPTR